MLSGSQKKGKSWIAKKKKKRNISRNNGLTLLEFAKRHKQEIQGAGWIPNGINAKEPMANHIIIKLLKTIEIQNHHKEKILKATREKWHITYKEATIWMNAGFSSETMQARKKGITYFKVCKEFYIWWKYPSGIKTKGKHSQPKKIYKNWLPTNLF